MTRPSQRLSVVVDMARRKEDDAAKVLEKKRAQLDDEIKRLDDLNTYYSEYETRFKENQHSVRAQDFAKKRDFLNQLSHSRSIQALQLQHVQREFDLAIGEWHQCHLKSEKLCEYVEGLKRQEMADIDRKEQKAVDEWVTQTHARKNSP